MTDHLKKMMKEFVDFCCLWLTEDSSMLDYYTAILANTRKIAGTCEKILERIQHKRAYKVQNAPTSRVKKQTKKGRKNYSVIDFKSVLMVFMCYSALHASFQLTSYLRGQLNLRGLLAGQLKITQQELNIFSICVTTRKQFDDIKQGKKSNSIAAKRRF